MSRALPVTLTNLCMLRDADGRVLTIDRRDSVWSGIAFPGGHVEPGESLTRAVIREMREETGLTIAHPRLAGVKNWVNDDGSRYIVLCYTATEYTGDLCASDEGEVRWIPLDEMRRGNLASDMEGLLRLLLEDALSEQWWEQQNGEWHEVLL